MEDQEVIDGIVSRIRRFFISPDFVCCDVDNPTSPHHILWMCNQIHTVDLNKKSQWAGFLLAVMISNGLVDVDKEQAMLQQIMKL